MRKSSLLGAAALGVMTALSIVASAQAQELTTKWKGAPEFSNDDVRFKFRGRVLFDAVWESVDFDRANPALPALPLDYDARNFRGRQAFLGVEGQLNSQWAYKVEGGAVNGGAWSWDDVVIEFKPTETTSILFGNIKVVSIENLTSTRFTSFMDRGPFADITDASYTLGVVAKTSGPNWSASLGVQGDSINSGDVTAPGSGQFDRQERLAISGRLHYAPINDDFTKLHTAVWYRYRDGGSEVFQYRARPNTNYGDRLIDTGGNYGNKDRTIGVEGALVHRNFSVQGEWAQLDVDGNANPVLLSLANRRQDAKFDTGYVFVSWFPTGEMRNYNAVAGEFGRTKVLNPTTAGGWGAIELLARYEYADLTDARTGSGAKIATAGKMHNTTFGINYFPFSYVRFTANYTKSSFDNPKIGVTKNAGDADVFQLRAQLDW